ncbi:MAG: hypothetical protein UU78_C0038G0001, partial [Candidatus Roizmanbacteria bacterium GW2011_GWC2_41_7]
RDISSLEPHIAPVYGGAQIAQTTLSASVQGRNYDDVTTSR